MWYSDNALHKGWPNCTYSRINLELEWIWHDLILKSGKTMDLLQPTKIKMWVWRIWTHPMEIKNSNRTRHCNNYIIQTWWKCALLVWISRGHANQEKRRFPHKNWLLVKKKLKPVTRFTAKGHGSEFGTRKTYSKWLTTNQTPSPGKLKAGSYRGAWLHELGFPVGSFNHIARDWKRLTK